MTCRPLQLKAADSEVKSKTEQIAALDAELVALREKLTEAEATASAQGEQLETLRAAIKDVNEVRSTLESNIVSLQAAASVASAAALEHANVKEEVIVVLELFVTLPFHSMAFRPYRHSSRLLRPPMLRPARRFRNLRSSTQGSGHP